MRDTFRTILIAVVSAATIALLLPVGAQAAGQLMTIVDPQTNAKARVDAGELRVGDGDGALTVNGTIDTREFDVNRLLYRSPEGGLDCGGGAISLGMLDLSRHSHLRIDVYGGSTEWNIHVRAVSEGVAIRVLDELVPESEVRSFVLNYAPTTVQVLAIGCSEATVFIYGIR